MAVKFSYDMGTKIGSRPTSSFRCLTDDCVDVGPAITGSCLSEIMQAVGDEGGGYTAVEDKLLLCSSREGRAPLTESRVLC